MVRLENSLWTSCLVHFLFNFAASTNFFLSLLVTISSFWNETINNLWQLCEWQFLKNCLVCHTPDNKQHSVCSEINIDTDSDFSTSFLIVPVELGTIDSIPYLSESHCWQTLPFIEAITSLCEANSLWPADLLPGWRKLFDVLVHVHFSKSCVVLDNKTPCSTQTVSCWESAHADAKRAFVAGLGFDSVKSFSAVCLSVDQPTTPATFDFWAACTIFSPKKSFVFHIGWLEACEQWQKRSSF